MRVSAAEAHVRPTPTHRLMGRVSWKAILLSSALDLALSMALVTAFGVFLFGVYDVASLPSGEQSTELTRLLAHSPYVLVTAALGFASSTLAGYVAAAIAKREWLLYGALSASASTVVASFTIVSGTHPYSVPVSILLLPLAPLFGAVGGYLRLRRDAALASP
jgi:hypothetical protein